MGQIEIKLIGMKHIFLSESFLQKYNYKLLENYSFAVPLYHRNKTTEICEHVDGKKKHKEKILVKVSTTELKRNMMIEQAKKNKKQNQLHVFEP